MHLMMSVHFAHICPAKVLELLEMVPEVLLMQDTLGRTPLHTLLENINDHKYRDMREDWQQHLTQHLTGVTAGLLPRNQTKRLMMLSNAANQCPLQYYLANFVNEHRRNHTHPATSQTQGESCDGQMHVRSAQTARACMKLTHKQTTVFSTGPCATRGRKNDYLDCYQIVDCCTPWYICINAVFK